MNSLTSSGGMLRLLSQPEVTTVSNRITHRPRPRLILLAAGGLAALALTLPAAAQRRYPPNWPAANKGCGPDHPHEDTVSKVFRSHPTTSVAALTALSELVLVARVSGSSRANWVNAIGGSVIGYTLSSYSVLKRPPASETLGNGIQMRIFASGGTALNPQGLCVYDSSDPVLFPGAFLIFARYSPGLKGYLGTAWYWVRSGGALVPASGRDVSGLGPVTNLAAAVEAVAREVVVERERSKK